MFPAHQRLVSDDQSIRCRDPRLEIELELTALQSALDIGFERTSLLDQFVHAPAVGSERVPTGLLGVIEGDVSTADQFVELARMLRAKRTTDADTAFDAFALAGVKGLPEGFDQAATEIFALGFEMAIAEDDRELVTAEASRHVGGTECCGQTPRRLSDHLVASRVPVKIVDVLEMVEIDQKNPATPPVIRLFDMGGERFGKQRTVRKPCQRIVLRQMAHAAFDGLALTKIDEAADPDMPAAIFYIAAPSLDRDA